MPNDVLFAGYEFLSKNQRGIYLYMKSLIRATKKSGARIGLFTDAKNLRSHSALLPYIHMGLDNPSIVPRERDKKRLAIKYIKARLLNLPRTRLVNKDMDIINEESMRYLDDVDFFLNMPDIYAILATHESLPFNEPYKLNLNSLSERSTIFTTSPLSIRLKGKKLKLIQTLHDIIPLKVSFHGEDTQRFYNRLKAIDSHSDAILAVSEYSKNCFLELFPHASDRIKVIYQPVPADPYLIHLSTLEAVQKATLLKFGLKEGCYSFYVGAVEQRKNIERLVSAYSLSSNAVDIPLIIAGGADVTYLREKGLDKVLKLSESSPSSQPIRRNSPKHERKPVRYIGYISELEKLCLLRCARAFMFPTLNEGFGIPPLEAQSLGCPVLTTNVSSLPEVVADSAYLIDDPYNIEELAHGIDRLLSDDDLCMDLSSKGTQNSKRFSDAIFAREVGEFLSSVSN